MSAPALDELRAEAASLLDSCRALGLRIATAESCTGGLLAAILTDIPGSSDVFERGFVTYSNESKSEMLGFAIEIIHVHGAVSEEVARMMAEGAIFQSVADLGIAVTGIAGPGGGTDEKPVGLVHVAAMRRDGRSAHRRCRFAPDGRDAIRRLSVGAAFALSRDLL